MKIRLYFNYRVNFLLNFVLLDDQKSRGQVFVIVKKENHR